MATEAFRSLWDWDTINRENAWAQSDKAGSGGWISFETPHSAQDVHWFSIQFTTVELPLFWDAPDNMQSAISSFELLAQVALIAMKFFLTGRRRMRMQIKLQTDSTPAEGTGNKLFTTNSRLAPIVLSLAHWATRCNVEIALERMPGVEHSWVDDWSRDNVSSVEVCANKRVHLDRRALWLLEPRAARSPIEASWFPYAESLSF